MRIVMGCGGTGGHIYPAIAIAEGLKEQFPAVDLLFIGAKGGMEVDIIAATGYPIACLSMKGFQRKKWFSPIRLLFLILKSFYQARKIIQRFKPDVVIGTGGYVSFPTLLAAYTQAIPTLIQEQNSTAGLTNRLLARLVTKICTGYPSVPFACTKEKIVVTGNPVRTSVFLTKNDRAEALRYFNLSCNKKCLLVVGGSGGSLSLNTALLAGVSQLHAWGIQLLWITGNRYFKKIRADLDAYYLDHTIQCYPFVDRMEMAYAAADVVVSRAGALSIAELCIAQKPTILVPSPNVVGDHQTKNSLPLLEQGAVLCLQDQECLQLLLPTIWALLQDRMQQSMLTKQMHPFALLHATALHRIVQEIGHLANANLGKF